jgi:pSer/pThr/pTyr-binding forkhead associated (FHA) protein
MPSLIHRQPDGTERVLTVGAKPLIIGRLVESEIQIRDSFISRVHAGIGYANNQFTLKDFGSANGTYRNGARVFECPLASGDKIQVGNTTLIFEIESMAGNGILRHAPQMVQPSRTVGGIAPDNRQMTVPIQVPPAPGS